ncbi:MAG: hypothetical protein R3C03_16965 [Pirellulaceae bacterium]
MSQRFDDQTEYRGRDDDASENPIVIQLSQDYMREWEAGRQPDRESLYTRAPQFRAELEECFDGIDLARTLPQKSSPAMDSPVIQGEALGTSRSSARSVAVAWQRYTKLNSFLSVAE